MTEKLTKVFSTKHQHAGAAQRIFTELGIRPVDIPQGGGKLNYVVEEDQATITALQEAIDKFNEEKQVPNLMNLCCG